MPVLNLNGIKTALQTMFMTANTTTASTDLSSGLGERVRKVLKLNPARIPIQATYYPYVSVYIDSKEMEDQTMQGGRSLGRVRGTVEVKIVGAVWNSNIPDPAADESDDDAESLMENIEEILRADATIGGTVKWCFPTAVTFHNAQIGEETHLRVGVMNLKATAFY